MMDRRQVGYIDWVGGNGLPYRSTLYDDGRWVCSEPSLSDFFTLSFRPEDNAGAGAYGFVALEGASLAMGGVAHYTAPLFGPPLEEGEVE